MAKRGRASRPSERDPQWYKDAVVYQLHVRAFYDSDADGIGDFGGLTEKLDYLRDLGVTALWLLPFYPSPLKDDGYDIADYHDVHPSYGTLSDFRTFLREAHDRGLRVITELVINHTSDQHPWFQRARRAKPGSPEREFYVWTDNPDKYREARIIFKDFEHSNWTWDPVARAYYWHRFYAHQPDLNFDNPKVREAVIEAMDFWLEMGVDGMRLDAVPYLYEREGTNCENLPETHAFLKELRRHVDATFEDRMLLAEANQWPEDAVAYFGDGDECHMAFHFPVMPRMFMAIHMEDRFPIIDILTQTPAIPETAQWAVFLRNHDELTLEMVTDEERDYMYRVYASDPQARINLGIRRRLAPLLGNHRRSIELMNGLLLSLPGTPTLYYGDEIGMGDNIYLGDRNGVRTPMQWSADLNAGFSRANPQRLYLPVIIDPEYHYEAVNADSQRNNLHSLFWWMKRIIALRKRVRAFGRGSIEFLYPENRKVLAFIRRYGEERILVVANLSRFVQYAELDLSAFEGCVPTEVFGRTEFPAVAGKSYFLTLAPHGFIWFTLEPPRVIPAAAVEAPVPALQTAGEWSTVLSGRTKEALEGVLPAFLRTRRWFGGKARGLKSAKITRSVPIPSSNPIAHLALVEVEYLDGIAETYALPLAFASGERAQEIRAAIPHAVVASLLVRAKDASQEGVLYDAVWEPRFCEVLLEAIARRRRWRGERGELVASHTRDYRTIRGPAETRLEPRVLGAEQSNTSVVFGDRFILKLFRRIDRGVNPELEVGQFLTERVAFPHTPPVAGAIEYREGRSEPMTLGMLQGFVPNEGDAWTYTLDAVGGYVERVLALPPDARDVALPAGPLLTLTEHAPPPRVQEAIGAYLESARLLGQRTAEMHAALASDPQDPAFAPEPFSALYQRSLFQSMRSLTRQTFALLRKSVARLPEAVRADAQRALDWESRVLKRFEAMRERKVTAMRIRCHGDYHLGQVLYTGKDFVIIDFEGEATRSLSERRMKRSALRDVAGMLRSFHYAPLTVVARQAAEGIARPEDVPSLRRWAQLWYLWSGATFLRAYLEAAAQAAFLPKAREEIAVLLDLYLLEKAVYELAYELNHRPAWVTIPVAGIAELLGLAD